MDPLSAAIGGGLGALGSIASSAITNSGMNNRFDKNREFLMSLGNRADQNQQTMKDTYFSPVTDYALSQMYPLSSMLQGAYGPGMDQAQYLNTAYNPGSFGIGNGGVGDTAAQMFQGGGWTPNGQYAQDVTKWAMGNDNPARQATFNTGLGIVGNQGQTNDTGQLRLAGSQASQNQGYNPYLTAGMNAAMGVMNNPQSQMAQQAGQIALQNFGKQALLPTEQAAGIAKEGALSDFDKQMQHLQAQALARGGAPGSITAAGAQTGSQMDTALDRIKTGNDAYRNALTGQQGLNLQQQSMMGSMIPQLEGLSNQNILGGLGSIGNLSNAAVNNLGTQGNLGINALGAETQRLGLGTGMLNDYTNTAMQGAGQLGSLVNQQQQKRS